MLGRDAETLYAMSAQASDRGWDCAHKQLRAMADAVSGASETRVDGVSYDGDEAAAVCVAEACRAYGIATSGGWGPRTGAVLAARRSRSAAPVERASPETAYRVDFLRGQRAGRVFCERLRGGEIEIQFADGGWLFSNNAWDQEHADEVVDRAMRGDRPAHGSTRKPREWVASGRRFPREYVDGFTSAWKACRARTGGAGPNQAWIRW